MHFRSEQSKLSNNLAMDQADPGTPAEQKAEAQESAKTLDDIIASLKQKDTTKGTHTQSWSRSLCTLTQLLFQSLFASKQPAMHPF